jgi:hypothetical protein
LTTVLNLTKQMVCGNVPMDFSAANLTVWISMNVMIHHAPPTLPAQILWDHFIAHVPLDTWEMALNVMTSMNATQAHVSMVYVPTLMVASLAAVNLDSNPVQVIPIALM